MICFSSCDKSRLRDCRNHHFISTHSSSSHVQTASFFLSLSSVYPFHSRRLSCWIFRFANYKGRLIHPFSARLVIHYSSIWSTCLDQDGQSHFHGCRFRRICLFVVTWSTLLRTEKPLPVPFVALFLYVLSITCKWGSKGRIWDFFLPPSFLFSQELNLTRFAAAKAREFLPRTFQSDDESQSEVDSVTGCKCYTFL